MSAVYFLSLLLALNNLQAQQIYFHEENNNRNQVIGVMICSAYYEDIMAPGSVDIIGCEDGQSYSSVETFFKKYRRKETFSIKNIIYYYQHNKFFIYYKDN